MHGSWWIAGRYLYDFKNYISEIRGLQGLKWYTACSIYVKFNLSFLIIWGEILTLAPMAIKQDTNKGTSYIVDPKLSKNNTVFYK